MVPLTMPFDGPSTVAVLGAAGTIAPAIIRDLAESDEVAQLRLLDLDGERAAAVAAAHAPGKARAAAVDARSVDELATRLAGADVLVNTASYRINLEAMQACLSAGCHYVDLGGLYWMTLRQQARHDDFERAGLLAVLGIGSSPGKTNLMARDGVRRLAGETIASIDIAAAGRDPVAASDARLRPPYSIQTLIDELTLAPVVLRDGEPHELAPLTEAGVVDYGDPIGRARVIYTLHSELATFGASFGCREASFQLSLAPALLDRLKGLIGATPDEIAAAQRDAAPASNQTVSVHLVTIGTAGGRRLQVRAESHPHFGLGGSIVSTAAPAAASVRLLTRGRITARGALPPERCIEPADMFAELEARGCRFSISG
ncbi:MAG TPA: saccharopine dehydrogenase NADP-binding domain-containing protein [Solirubrobacteraceae bacterium]